MPVERIGGVSYLNVKQLVRSVAPLARSAGGPPLPTILEALGLDDVQAVGSVAGLDGETFISRTLVMLELPALPLRNDIGLAQRELAWGRHVLLIPRRVMCGALAAPENTQRDGLHLSRLGHERFAAEMARRFGVDGEDG